ncbi:MAG: AAA family ATPase, partial [Thaumarchaeota archaeon]|nr:AAA family ATPase [Nitrososphaerota archaeon]
PQMIKPYYGQTEKVISDLFDEARKNAPAIIVIDEVDALMLRRDAGGNLGAVTTLLSEMGGMKPLEGVVVIGTTNKLHLIDEAFLRAGRFDRVIEIPPPKNDRERVEIINIHLKKCSSFLDPHVTGEAVLPLFGKRTVSPARIEWIVSDAIELRVKELNAIHKLSQMPDQQDTTQVQRLKHIYQDDLLRLRTNLGFSPPAEVEGKTIDSASLSHLLEVTPENYKLNLNHFKEAINLSKDNQIEEIQRITSAIRGSNPEPAVGKVYGLAALSGSGTGDGLAADGTIAGIECACNPYGDRGHAEVIGSEVADSIKASAEHARIFLNEQSDWDLRNVEFFIDFITFAKGLDSKVIQGPSAGAAITLAEFSALTKEKVLPNVVITGGVTPKGELIQVGGLDFKGMGKFVAALNTDGIDTIVIPESNFANLAEEDKTFFAQKGLKVVAAKNFWEVAEVALESRPNRGQIIDKIRAYRKETNEHSNAGGSHY